MNNINNKKNDHETGLEVAVIGMAGKYPGARNLEELWDNLKNGRETIKFFTKEELVEAGESEEILDQPGYVPARGVLEDIDCFDAAFFGYTPSEAQIMDPQTRLFHQCAWHALEDAAYDPYTYDGLIGVYAGSKHSVEWQLKLAFFPTGDNVDGMTKAALTNKDHVAMRISYMFNLRGPSFTFFTACSTSLVAIHLGCQALLSGECDIALAGGVTIGLPQDSGYFHIEDLVYSKDGHVKTFDADGSGIVDSSGVGVVVLKTLEEALNDGDNIHAVIKGTGVNNDGSRKIGYTAPSILGQESLLRDVYQAAEVDVESITYVECHGTATPLGDPIEVEALTRAFETSKRHYCGLGSIKSNIGHSDSAAGVAGFLKTVLALKNRQIPPSLHFKNPNPQINFQDSPFYVNTQLRDWDAGDYPLRAGVSSLGIGGTNAHVVVQEAPPESLLETSTPVREYQLLPLSAKSPEALEQMTQNLARFLEANPAVELADVAYTLKKGRACFRHRRTFTCAGADDAVKQLYDPGAAPVQPFFASEKDRPVVFMFSGQGSQYVNMGRDLYQKETSFREDIDEGFRFLKGLINEDLTHILYPDAANEAQVKEAEEKIHRIYYTQPAKFIFEYAMARLLMRWGVKPHGMIGHSFGEYVAAALSGVFSLEDALKLVMLRGEQLEKAQTGSMLSVSLSESQLRPLLPSNIALAAINTDYLCLVAGEVAAVEAFQKQLEAQNIDTLLLRVSRAGHSPLMDSILPEFKEKLKGLKFNKPQIPYISCVSGTWVTEKEVMDPGYWTRHLRETVRFGDGLKTLFETPNAIYLEVGAGTGLTNYVNQFKMMGDYPNLLTANMVRHHKDTIFDDCFLMTRLGQLWSYGKTIDWESFYGEEKRRKVSLPLYPFQMQSYWIDVDPRKALSMIGGRRRRVNALDLKDCFYIPSWKSTLLTTPKSESLPETGPQTAAKPWLIFMDDQGWGEKMVRVLEAQGRSLITVRQGEGFAKTAENDFSLNPIQPEDYEALFKDLAHRDFIPATIIHLWNICRREDGESALDWNCRVQDTGYHSLVFLALAVGRQFIMDHIQVEVVTDGMQSVSGEPLEYPEKATILGPVKDIPQEYPNLKCRTIDVELLAPGGAKNRKAFIINRLLDEFARVQTSDQVFAYRGNQRLKLDYERITLEEPQTPAPCFREKGVYLITGGLGGVGLALGRFLVEKLGAKLVLTSRSGLPPREQWDAILQQAAQGREEAETSGEDVKDVKDGNAGKVGKEISKKAEAIRQIMAIEAVGGEVMVLAVDIADAPGMREAVEQVKQRFGPVNGIIQSAYVADGTVIHQRTRETSERVFAPKVQGTLVLDQIFAQEPPLDFFMLCSSMAAIFGPVGQVGYTAANAFQDAFAHSRTLRTFLPTVSINWYGWSETGGARDSLELLAPHVGIEVDQLLQGGLLTSEGVDAFARIMNTGSSQVLVTKMAVDIMMDHLNTSRTSGLQESLAEPTETEQTQTSMLKRPQLDTPYIAPRNKVEETIAGIWQNLFGFETVGIKDDFFQLGGDSLKAMTVASRIHQALDRKIPIAVFFGAPTIEELAQFIVGEEEKDIHAVIPFAEKKEYYPLSPVQMPLFYLHRKEQGNPHLNITMCFQFPIMLEKEQLRQAFQAFIQRHDIYRTSFHLVKGQPVQRFHDDLQFAINEVQSTRELLQDTIRDLVTPFDLEQAPLFRVSLVRVEGKWSVLVLDTHQMLLDGTSASFFISDFMAIFSGKELPPVALGYGDYSQWLFNRYRSGEMKEAENYWLSQFKEPVSPMNLPTDFPRPDERDYEGEPAFFDVQPELLMPLRNVAADNGATMFMIWISAFYVLLHRHSGSEDFAVGSRLACRLHTDLEPLIGKFSNTVGFRAQPQPAKTFKQFLGEIKELALNAFKYQEYPFELLLERLNFEPDPGRNALYDTVFVYNNQKPSSSSGDGGGEEQPQQVPLEAYTFRKIRTPFDMLFQVNEVGDVIIVLMHFATSLFKPETIQRFILNFRIS